MNIKLCLKNLKKYLNEKFVIKCENSDIREKDVIVSDDESEIRKQKYYNENLNIIENKSINQTRDFISAIGYNQGPNYKYYDNVTNYLFCIRRGGSDEWIEIFNYDYGTEANPFIRGKDVQFIAINELVTLSFLSEEEEKQIAFIVKDYKVAKDVFDLYLKKKSQACNQLYKKIR